MFNRSILPVLLCALGAALPSRGEAASYTGVVNEIQAVSTSTQTFVRYEDSVGFNPGVLLQSSNASLNQALVPLFYCKASITFTYTPAACPSGTAAGKSCGTITAYTAGPCY